MRAYSEFSWQFMHTLIAIQPSIILKSSLILLLSIRDLFPKDLYHNGIVLLRIVQDQSLCECSFLGLRVIDIRM